MAIAVAETVTGSTPDQASFTLTSWTPGANELVLVFVAVRDETRTVSVSGNGLTFVESIAVDNAQAQNGVHIFRAMGASPSAGQITVTVTSNTLPALAVACRFTGMDTSGTNGSGAIEATGSAAGPPVTDDDDMLVSVTTVTANAWAVAVGTHRNSTFTVPGGETQISINNTAGSGGALTSCSVWYESVVSPAATQLGAANDLSAVNDWCCVAVSIKPAGGTTYTQSAAGTLTSAGTLVRKCAKALTGALTSAGNVSRETSKALTGTLTSSGALAAIRTVYVALTGTLTSAGTLTRETSKSFTGALTSAGNVSRETSKILAGVLTTAGGLASQILHIFQQAVGGTLTSSGALIRKAKKSFVGTLTSAGALARKAKLTLGGTLTSAGALTRAFAQAAVALTLAARRTLTLPPRLRAWTVAIRNSLTCLRR